MIDFLNFTLFTILWAPLSLSKQKFMYICNINISIVCFKIRYIMKKTLVIVLTILVATIAVSACSHHTCPAYRGSVSMVE